MATIDLEKVFSREVERKDGRSLEIKQNEFGDVGCVVWDAALVLSKYLETVDFDCGKSLQGKKVVELGAGTGAVGLMAWSYGADVIITDLPEFLPLMQMNIDTNKDFLSQSRIECRTLRWGEDHLDFHPDIVLLADCIYYEQSLEPLVSTMDHLCGKHTDIYCCFEERLTRQKQELQKKFFKLVEEKFKTFRIPLERQDKHYRSEDIILMKFNRRLD